MSHSIRQSHVKLITVDYHMPADTGQAIYSPSCRDFENFTVENNTRNNLSPPWPIKTAYDYDAAIQMKIACDFSWYKH